MTPVDPKTEEKIDREMMLHRALWVGRYLVDCTKKFLSANTKDFYVREYVRQNIQ
jgi:hypothetical protein